MARPESFELSTIDDGIAAISIGHEQISIVLTRSAHRLPAADIAELASLDDTLERLHWYLLWLRPFASQIYQNGNTNA